MKNLLGFGVICRRLKKLLEVSNVSARMTDLEACYAEDLIFKPPTSVRGMLQLDRDAFTKQVVVPAVLVPLKSMSKFMKMFKSDAFKSRGAPLIDEDDGVDTSDSRWVTMRSDFDFKDVHHKKLESLEELGIKKILCQKKMEVRYEHYRHFEILGAILPEGLDSTSGFERVGHIAHVNLHEYQRPYKHIIGQVLIDTHKSIKTVVDKSCIIDNTYRNFEMEVIAGEEDYMTKVVEFGCTFEFDFSKVFWNSRLQTEHRRIYDLIPEGSTVFDVFAGVGPFSIPLSRKGCGVLANDLNGESYKWLCHNAKLNRTKIEAFNLDGREFIKVCLEKYLRSKPSNSNKIFVVMNLPGHAIDFLDAFQGLLSQSDAKLEGTTSLEDDFPRIHVFCYVFSSAEDKLGDIRERAAASLGESLPIGHTVREVRKVSPSKEQYCLSFEVQKSVLLVRDSEQSREDSGPDPKKPKYSESTTVS